ncbi:DUF3147 family protein [Euryarchaeota archaeon]|nr:DUF3147 family protein [Euryarchaeota archaeon]
MSQILIFIDMNWLNLIAKGIFSGAIIVFASEMAKKSAMFGALIVSIPLVSILSLIWLYDDTKDVIEVANFAESILWLVLPSTLLFILLPYLLRRGLSFESSMAIGVSVTIIAYLISIYVAATYSDIS